MQTIKEVLSKLEALVDSENTFIREEDEYYILNSLMVKDSFGGLYPTVHSEPEDACWDRDLQDNFYIGLSLGIRNTLKVIVENPKLLQQFIKLQAEENSMDTVDKICIVLKEIKTIAPEYRIGQTIANSLPFNNSLTDLFYYEDTKLLERLEHHLQNVKPKEK